MKLIIYIFLFSCFCGLSQPRSGNDKRIVIMVKDKHYLEDIKISKVFINNNRINIKNYKPSNILDDIVLKEELFVDNTISNINNYPYTPIFTFYNYEQNLLFKIETSDNKFYLMFNGFIDFDIILEEFPKEKGFYIIENIKPNENINWKDYRVTSKTNSQEIKKQYLCLDSNFKRLTGYKYYNSHVILKNHIEYRSFINNELKGMKLDLLYSYPYAKAISRLILNIKHYNQFKEFIKLNKLILSERLLDNFFKSKKIKICFFKKEYKKYLKNIKNIKKYTNK